MSLFWALILCPRCKASFGTRRSSLSIEEALALERLKRTLETTHSNFMNKVLNSLLSTVSTTWMPFSSPYYCTLRPTNYYHHPKKSNYPQGSPFWNLHSNFQVVIGRGVKWHCSGPHQNFPDAKRKCTPKQLRSLRRASAFIRATTGAFLACLMRYFPPSAESISYFDKLHSNLCTKLPMY